jgi:hypothetical protein
VLYAVGALALGGDVPRADAAAAREPTRPARRCSSTTRCSTSRCSSSRWRSTSCELEERELARKNNVWGWSLLALAIVLALGTVAVG